MTTTSNIPTVAASQLTHEWLQEQLKRHGKPSGLGVYIDIFLDPVDISFEKAMAVRDYLQRNHGYWLNCTSTFPLPRYRVVYNSKYDASPQPLPSS